ncbi:MAG: hypothetical protein ACLQUT_00025 [Thermoleophilia bacterium]
MTPPPVVLVAAAVAGHPLVAEAFPEAEPVVLERDDLRPPAPFSGRLFDLFAAWRGEGVTACGLVVPARWLGPTPTPTAFTVADHVNLELRGPLTGAWPHGVQRTFPCLTGIYQPAVVRPGDDSQYQPAVVRPADDPHVYSDVTVAGVRDLMALTLFESRAVARGGFAAVSDCLVPPVIVAVYHTMAVAAYGIVTAIATRESEDNQ